MPFHIGKQTDTCIMFNCDLLHIDNKYRFKISLENIHPIRMIAETVCVWVAPKMTGLAIVFSILLISLFKKLGSHSIING